MSTKKNEFESLRRSAIMAHENAYSPYSKAKVGSSVETDTGKHFSGCNVENCSFGDTVCAERVAIFNAISQGEKKIQKVYVYTKEGWTPCGSCRQVILEFATSDLVVIIGNEKGEEKIYKFKELLPHSFGPDQLDL